MPSRSAAFSPAASARAGRRAAPHGGRLEARQAISLRSPVPRCLHITQGRAWVTLGVPARGAGNALGDHMLEAGQRLRVPAGARLVMEPWQPGQDEPVHFEWCALSAEPGRFGREVARPTRELVVALGQAAGAFGRLVRGVLGYSEFLVAGRGRVLTRFESNF